MNNIERFDFLDAVTVADLFLQIYSMQQNDEYTKYINIELDKLHKENQEIIRLLRERKN